SDDYMTALLSDVLRFHLDAGGHAFLMSATLGASARARLLATAGSSTEIPSLELASQEAYPLLSHVAKGRPPLLQAVAHGGTSKTVLPRLLAIAGDPQATATLALDAAQAGACVLVVRNLVRDCVSAQRALETLASARG